jgi:D-glycerate 3-kinase
MNAGPWAGELLRTQKLPGHYMQSVRECIVPLAEHVAGEQQAAASPIVVGISGAQGCGKSTLALFLENCLRKEAGLRVATLQLDDLYFDLETRAGLACTKHALLRTRGVPGTHDVALGQRLLEQLTAGEGNVRLPVFDKVADDRLPRADWTQVQAPVDVVLLEGWCVGVRAQSASALQTPVNELEQADDADGRWRRYVNEQIDGDYARLFETLDMLVFLRVPSFGKVLEWRGLQEEKQGGPLDDAGLRRFVQHFERLSRHMLDTVPAYADVVVDIDDEHRLTGLQITGRSGDEV